MTADIIDITHLVRKIYYTATNEYGEEYDLECETAKEAFDFAEEQYRESCADNGCRSREDDIEVIAFYFDNDGEKQELSRVTETVEYEYYRGDYAEHNTHWGL